MLFCRESSPSFSNVPLKLPNGEEGFIQIEPGEAFGRGNQPSTMVCIKVMESIFKERKVDNVLDVGCGGGTKSKYLISRGLKVVGIDISENMINIAKTEVPEGKFIVMDLTEVGDLEDMFDGIFMQAVLLHIPKKDVPNILKRGPYRGKSPKNQQKPLTRRSQ